MKSTYSTHVPNVLFDTYLPKLSFAELKLLLVVIRQTRGWKDKRTGKRKTRDRISHSQFMGKAGLSRRVISKTITSLVKKGLVIVTDCKRNVLHTPAKRKGRGYLYYSFFLPQLVHSNTPTYARSVHEPVHTGRYNKYLYTKSNRSKGHTLQSISTIIETLQKKLDTLNDDKG